MQKYLITTKRLGLRLLRKDDATYLNILDKDEDVTKYFPNGPLDDNDIKLYIDRCLSNHLINNLPCFVIFKLKTDEFIGEAYFDQLSSGEIKVGYLFHKKSWHRGYATEVLQTLLDWAKHNIDTDYIIAYAHVANKASRHILEKCGMEHYKDEYSMDMKSCFYRIKNR